MHEPEDDLHYLLEQELRAAIAARIECGVHPGEVTADLARRLRRVQEMRSDTRTGSRRSSGS